MMAQKRSGFTLLEIVLVIVLLSVMVMTVAPLFTDFIPEVSLESEAKKVKAAIIFTQQQAVLTGYNHRIEFFKSKDTYEIYKASDAGGEILIKSDSLEHGVRYELIEVPSDELEFNNLGEPQPEGGMISLINMSGATAEITVRDISGLISIMMRSG